MWSLMASESESRQTFIHISSDHLNHRDKFASSWALSLPGDYQLYIRETISSVYTAILPTIEILLLPGYGNGSEQQSLCLFWQILICFFSVTTFNVLISHSLCWSLGASTRRTKWLILILSFHEKARKGDWLGLLRGRVMKGILLGTPFCACITWCKKEWVARRQEAELEH